MAPLPKLEAHAYTDGASGGSRAQLRLPQLIADGVFDPLLDLTGGNTIKRCDSQGCSNYFHMGPQSKSRYCSEQCANRASTRMRLGSANAGGPEASEA